MCVVSMGMDHYWDKWNPLRPRPYAPPLVPAGPYPPPSEPSIVPGAVPGQPTFPYPQPPYIAVPIPMPAPVITPAEVEEFRQLLERARKYDRDNNEPDCELDEKRERVKRLAEELRVKIDFL